LLGHRLAPLANSQEARHMTMIEQWLHVSPDGGSGTLEALFFAAPLLVMTLAFGMDKIAALRRVWRNIPPA
jgi:hypothetical protein